MDQISDKKNLESNWVEEILSLIHICVLCDPALYADRNPAFPRPVRFSGSHRSSSRYQIPWAFSCFARAGMCEYL